MNGSPDGEILARIEREIARTDPALAALYDGFLAASLRSRRRGVPRWGRCVLASIAVAVVVGAAVIAAIFVPPADACPVPLRAVPGGCAARSAPAARGQAAGAAAVPARG
jgi:hypothetical protein